MIEEGDVVVLQSGEKAVVDNIDKVVYDEFITVYNFEVKSSKVYQKGKYYYHRDTLHTGKSAHLEVYNKRGKHLGEADPKTGKLIPGTADPKKRIEL